MGDGWISGRICCEHIVADAATRLFGWYEPRAAFLHGVSDGQVYWRLANNTWYHDGRYVVHILSQWKYADQSSCF